MSVDELIQLGIEGNMEALEAERERMFTELIEQVEDEGQRSKLNGLHFKMKNLRYKYKNPLVAASKSYGIMLDSLNELNGDLKRI